MLWDLSIIPPYPFVLSPYYPGIKSFSPFMSLIKLYRQWAAFPDYFHNNAKKYWGTLIKEFYDKIEFDGLWIVSVVLRSAILGFHSFLRE
jgi:hypothetical protein